MYHIKESKYTKFFVIFSAALFLGMLIALVFTRAAWIDESWFAAYAINFIRTGEIADLNMARFTNSLPHLYFFYLYAILQAPVYYITGESLIAGRLITLFFAIAGIGVIYLNFKNYFQMKKIQAAILTMIIVLTYYYIYAATQIRPDLIAVIFVLTGMLFLKKWLQKEGTYWLILTHLMFIGAILLHLQAGFAWVGLWVFLLLNRVQTESRKKTIILSLLVYLAVAMLFVFNDYFESNMQNLYDTFFGGGDMAGHKGGMVGSIIEKFEKGEYLKFSVRMALLIVMVLNFLYYIYIKKITVFLNDPFFLVAGASFGSWLLTTVSINDYHAVWLTIPFMLMAFNMTKEKKFLKFLNGLFFIMLIIPSFIFTYNTLKNNPLQAQKLQIEKLNNKYDLTHKKLFIDRDLMWFYSFGNNVTYRLKNADAIPEFLLLRKGVHPKKAEIGFEKRKYKLIDETNLFLLYIYERDT